MIYKKRRNQKGQAIVEMVSAIPILLLFAVGILQLAITFLCYVQFEHASGEAAREYAAGSIDQNSLGPAIADNLGVLKKYFDMGSLVIHTQPPSANAGAALDKIRSMLPLKRVTMNYDGYEWSISIKTHPPFLFRILFSGGITFKTTLQVYRYPT